MIAKLKFLFTENQESYEHLQIYVKGELIPMSIFASIAITIDEVF